MSFVVPVSSWLYPTFTTPPSTPHRCDDTLSTGTTSPHSNKVFQDSTRYHTPQNTAVWLHDTLHTTSYTKSRHQLHPSEKRESERGQLRHEN
jgi:hypothetical protein